MRKFTSLTVLAIVFAVSANATVWRVNNTPNVDADFSNLKTAIDDASIQPFDTIYLEGSNNDYGAYPNITISKPIVIIGSGYFLNENDSTQANKNRSRIGHYLRFTSGSSGSVIKGCTFISAEYSGNIRIEESNITISRNYFKNEYLFVTGQNAIIISGTNITNILIEGNYILCNNTNSSGYGANCILSDVTGLNIIIQNNYLKSTNVNGVQNGINLSGETGNSIVVKNNVIEGNCITHGGQYFNNILIDGDALGTNNFYFNNLSDSTQFGNSNGNQENVDIATVFVDHLSGVDNGLILKPGSPAIGAGFSGGDCGIFGGTSPYVLSGLPSIPAIFEIIQTGVGNASLPIEVHFKATSHR